MRILITGAAGFIGYHASERFIKEGHKVFGVDNLNEYYDVHLKKARLARLTSPNYTFQRLDVTDSGALMSVLGQQTVDCIVHLAAIAGVRYSLDHGDEYIKTNVDGTYNIFDCARRLGIPKVIYASSSSVYGEHGGKPSSEDDPVDKPISLYAATKKANELLAYTYYHLFGIRSIGLRFFTVYGPWGRPDMALFLFTKGILDGKPIDVYNYGNMKRDFTYIDDIVAGIFASLSYDKTPYEIINLGYGKQVHLLDFIKHIEIALGKKANMHLMGIQPGDVTASLSDISKARRLLGYEPRTSVAEGVKLFVDWYLEYYLRG